MDCGMQALAVYSMLVNTDYSRCMIPASRVDIAARENPQAQLMLKKGRRIAAVKVLQVALHQPCHCCLMD